jgi:hypothetical protein
MMLFTCQQDKQSFYKITCATIEQCRKLTNSQEIIETIHFCVDEYLNQAVNNTQVYFSRDFGVAFPYTVIRLLDIANAIYNKIDCPNINDLNNVGFISEEIRSCIAYEERSRPQKIFIFGTSFSIFSAHPYHWTEFGIDQIVKKIPEALLDLSRGKIPQDFEIYGIGNPAGELGSLSKEFVIQAGEHPFEHLGMLYASFINTLQHHQPADRYSPLIRLWGVSMGANIAATTAHILIQKKQARQSLKDTEKPYIPLVRVTMQVPVSNSRFRLRRWQIKAGFFAEIAYQTLINAYGREVGNAEHKFISTIHHKLLDRGIEPLIDDEGKSIKEMLIKKLINQFLDGVSIPLILQVNEIIGIYDPLSYSCDFQKKAHSQNNRAYGSLGANIVPSKEKSKRQFAIKMTHTPAVIRQNYFKRLIKLAKIIHEFTPGNGKRC